MKARRLALRWGLRLFCLAYVGFLVGVPAGSVVWRALSPGFSSAWNAVTTPAAIHAFVLTLESAALAVALNTVFGVGMALLLARRRFPGASLLEALVDLPLSLSPVVVGLGLVLLWSSREGWAGPWLAARCIEVICACPGIVIASAFVSLPYVVREVLPVLQEVGDEQEQAAETLGAGALTTFWRITLPTIRWGLAYGVLLTTARILGEFGAMSVVSGDIVSRTQTFTQFVSDSFTNFDPAGAYAGALLLGLLSVAVLAALSFSRSREARIR
ncbi:MAG: sulfate transporter, inner rane subunit [Acidimicrobiaceae bacterium]|nr:sulfate transporter, inner rane subunit [Acidimicrobiaceae bacterium]